MGARRQVAEYRSLHSRSSPWNRQEPHAKNVLWSDTEAPSLHVGIRMFESGRRAHHTDCTGGNDPARCHIIPQICSIPDDKRGHQDCGRRCYEALRHCRSTSQPLDDSVRERLDFHLAGHARSFDLSPYATDFYQKLYIKDHEIFVIQWELVAANQIIRGLCTKVESLEAMCADVQEASVKSASRDLLFQQTKLETFQQDTALVVMSLNQTIADLSKVNAQQYEVAADMAVELAELVANLEESCKQSGADLVCKLSASRNESNKKLEQMKRHCVFLSRLISSKSGRIASFRRFTLTLLIFCTAQQVFCQRLCQTALQKFTKKK